MLEENLKNTRLAQSGKALPDTVPMSIALRQTAPGDIVDGEIVQGLQKQPVISTLVAPPWKRDAENLKCVPPSPPLSSSSASPISSETGNP